MSELKTPNPSDPANRDPITKARGAHPVGVGVGAAVGGAAAGVATAAATGAAVGTAAGPVGTVVGAAVGAVVGGLAGKAVAEHYDPTVEDRYWREHHKARPYVSGGSYDDFGPAYAYGVSSYGKYSGRKFDEVESELSRNWTGARGKSSLSWDRAKPATQDAWDRLSS